MNEEKVESLAKALLEHKAHLNELSNALAEEDLDKVSEVASKFAESQFTLADALMALVL